MCVKVLKEQRKGLDIFSLCGRHYYFYKQKDNFKTMACQFIF